MVQHLKKIKAVKRELDTWTLCETFLNTYCLDTKKGCLLTITYSGRSNKDGSQQEMKEDQLFDVRAYNTRNDPIPLPSPLEQSPVRVQNEGFSGYEAFTVRQSDDMEMTDWNAN